MVKQTKKREKKRDKKTTKQNKTKTERKVNQTKYYQILLISIQCFSIVLEYSFLN